MNKTSFPRITSIDFLRAITMVLMIFVNDLWSLKNIPEWLEHTQASDDGMGLADTVFPAFLVIVGMSIPFSVSSRRAKNESDSSILGHILLRTFALLTMGVFLVNGETINAAASGFPSYVYYPACCLCFILIWNNYPKTFNKTIRLLLQILAWISLTFLAWKYRGGNDGSHRFGPGWWGILGLIGWAYLVSAVVYTFAGKKLIPVILFWLVCILFCTAAHAGIFKNTGLLRTITGPLGQGAMPALVSAGVISSMIFLNMRDHPDKYKFMWVLLALSGGLCIAGFLVRPIDGISKIKATPSWVLICSAITFAIFAFVYWLADIKKQTAWSGIIRPAGTNTLLCYLLPYFAYAILGVFSFKYPELISTGVAGLIKSFIFALVIVNIGGLLGKNGVQVKL